MHYSRTRTHTILFLLVLVTALSLRLWQIAHLPPGFHYDEAFEGVDAWRILTDPSYHPIFLTRDFGIPPLNAYTNALVFGLFRMVNLMVGPTAMRSTAALIGVLGVCGMWLLAEELRCWAPRFSASFPFWAAGALAVMRWHIHYSRMGIEAIWVPMLWSFAMWTLLRGWRTSSLLYFIGSAIALALCLYAYMGAWVTPLLMIPLVLYLTLYQWRQERIRGATFVFHRHIPWRAISLCAGVALALALPLLWFFWQNPQWLLMRPSQLIIVGETGSPADSTLWSNVWKTAKMFGPFGEPGDMDPRRNLPGAPALNVWLAIPFYLGLVTAIWRLGNPASFIAIISLVGLLLPGIFSEYAPHFNRIQGAAAPTALLCGMGLDTLWRWRADRARLVRWSAVLLLLVGGVASARNYFGRWSALPDLFYAFDEGLWQAGQWIAAQPADTIIYETPRSRDHATLEFSWETADVSNIPTTFDGRHIFPFTAGASAQDEYYVVIEHEDFRTRLLLPGIFPDAEIVHEIRDTEQQLYAQIYRRPVGSVPQVEPQHPISVEVGDGIELWGYDTQPAEIRAGETLYVQYHWSVSQEPSADWTIFTHVLQTDAEDTVTQVAGFDSPPGAGSFPTSEWKAGHYVLDEHQVALPPELAAGIYTLRSGMYRTVEEALVPLNEPILLGEIEIVP